MYHESPKIRPSTSVLTFGFFILQKIKKVIDKRLVFMYNDSCVTK